MYIQRKKNILYCGNNNEVDFSQNVAFLEIHELEYGSYM